MARWPDVDGALCALDAVPKSSDEGRHIARGSAEIGGSAEMDSFAAYGSDSSQDDGIANESAAVPSFKPAWQTADEDDSEDESKEDAQGQKAEAPAAKEDHKPVPARADEPAVKRKKLPSALDALNTATPTFLASAPEPEPDEVRPPPPTPC